MKLSIALSASLVSMVAVAMAATPSGLKALQKQETKNGITVQEEIFNCYNNNARCIVADQDALKHGGVKMTPLNTDKALCNRYVPTPNNLSNDRQQFYNTAPYECTSNTDLRMLIECTDDTESYVDVEMYGNVVGYNAYGQARARFDAKSQWTMQNNSIGDGKGIPQNFVYVDCKPSN